MIGQAFSGIFVASLTIPALPEMIVAANHKLNLAVKRAEAREKAD